MPRAQEEFLTTVRELVRRGETVIQSEMGTGPAEALIEYRHDDLDGFYSGVSKWDSWVTEFDALLRSRIEHPDRLTRSVERRLDSGLVLRFAVRGVGVNGLNTTVEIDLRQRARWTGREACAELRTLLQRGRMLPTWSQLRQALIDALREVKNEIVGSVPQLGLIGEPRLPTLDDACLALAALGYVDVATTKKHVVDAETDFRRGRWKPASAVARCAIERITEDSFAELCRRQPATQPQRALLAQSEALGRAQFPSVEAQRFIYGVYALLSEVGSHAGDVADDDGECAFHAWVLAISLLAQRLPR